MTFVIVTRYYRCSFFTCNIMVFCLLMQISFFQINSFFRYNAKKREIYSLTEDQIKVLAMLCYLDRVWREYAKSILCLFQPCQLPAAWCSLVCGCIISISAYLYIIFSSLVCVISLCFSFVMTFMTLQIYPDIPKTVSLS